MTNYIPAEEVQKNWPVIAGQLLKFWDTTINLETIEGLYAKLMTGSYQLWIHTSEDKEWNVIITTSVDVTSTLKILTLQHCAGINETDESFTPERAKELHVAVMKDMEEAAKNLGLDGVALKTRPSSVRLLRDAGYKVWSTTILKQF